MIEAKQSLIGTLNSNQNLTGKLNKATEYVQPDLQEKTVTPTKEKQDITADKGGYVLSKVTVEQIPDEYIIPAGTVQIVSNGVYDVSDKASADVDIPTPKLETKTITKNGTYKASDDGLDGYSDVTVETSGVDITEYFGTRISLSQIAKGCVKRFPHYVYEALTNTYPSQAFSDCYSLEEVELFDTSEQDNFQQMFNNCSKLKTIPQFNMAKCRTSLGMFNYCPSLKSVPELNFQTNRQINGMFDSCTGLTYLGGFQDLGKNYSTSSAENYYAYTLNLSYSVDLTHESLMNVINKLYDIASKGVNPQKLTLGQTNLTKLTAEEIAIAQNKGWTVS